VSTQELTCQSAAKRSLIMGVSVLAIVADSYKPEPNLSGRHAGQIRRLGEAPLDYYRQVGLATVMVDETSAVFSVRNRALSLAPDACRHSSRPSPSPPIPSVAQDSIFPEGAFLVPPTVSNTLPALAPRQRRSMSELSLFFPQRPPANASPGAQGFPSV
jgi:hypothetical protein